MLVETPVEKKEITQSSDDQLIHLALTGSQRAYTMLVNRHKKILNAVVRQYLKAEEDVTEVVQDAFIRAFRALPSFRGDCKFSSWLYRIATFAAIDRVRLNQQRVARATEVDAWVSSFSSLEFRDSSTVEKKDLIASMRKAVSALSSSDSTVINLFYLQEQSIDEICESTGLSKSNIKSRLSRARIRLKDIIEERFAQELLN